MTPGLEGGRVEAEILRISNSQIEGYGADLNGGLAAP
jgi:hypothetical protein